MGEKEEKDGERDSKAHALSSIPQSQGQEIGP